MPLAGDYAMNCGMSDKCPLCDACFRKSVVSDTMASPASTDKGIHGAGFLPQCQLRLTAPVWLPVLQAGKIKGKPQPFLYVLRGHTANY